MSDVKLVRMPADLHQRAKVYCAHKNLTLTDLVARAVEEQMKLEPVGAAES